MATVTPAVATLQQEVEALKAAHAELKAAHDIDVRNLDVSWIIICSECLPSSPETLPLRAGAVLAHVQPATLEKESAVARAPESRCPVLLTTAALVAGASRPPDKSSKLWRAVL